MKLSYTAGAAPALSTAEGEKGLCQHERNGARRTKVFCSSAYKAFVPGSLGATRNMWPKACEQGGAVVEVLFDRPLSPEKRAARSLKVIKP